MNTNTKTLKSMQKELSDETKFGTFGSYLANPFTPAHRKGIVAKRMAILREEAGMSQRDVCAIICCTPQTYSGYETGKHEPSAEVLVRLSHLYNVSLDYLLGRNAHDELASVVDEVENVNENGYLLSLLAQMNDMNERLYLLERAGKAADCK